MIEDLVILNLPRDSKVSIHVSLTNLQWQTCLRRLVFLHRSEAGFVSPGMDLDLYRGRQAYQFLLQVICGLQSPLLGETAVMGQFRKFRNTAKFNSTPWGGFLQNLTTDLLRDARCIRERYLQNLGSQSYGSLIRKYLRGNETVALLGTGELSQDLLPRLSDDEIGVRVFYRSWTHARGLMDHHLVVQLNEFSPGDAGWTASSAALVIAAPISAAEITRWIDQQATEFSILIDLRGEASKDPIQSNKRMITLSDLFGSLNDEKERLACLASKAFGEIETISRQRFQASCEQQRRKQQYRPMLVHALCT